MTTETSGRRKQFAARHTVERLAASVLSVMFLIRAAFDAFYPLRQAEWMVYAEDDFFYYLKIAQNLGAGRGSTFNGLVRTNGYHPLWLALLAAVARIFHSETAMRGFLACCIFVSTFSTYLLLRRLFDAHIENRLFTTSLAVLLTLYSKIVLEGGMETLLTFPLLLAVLLVYQSDRLWRGKTTAFFGFGLLLSLTIFSRLDTLVLVVLLGLATGLQSRLRMEMNGRRILGVVAGLSPVLIYVLYNHSSFGLWLTVSGAAKQLKTGYFPSKRAWRSVVLNRPAAFFLVFASFGLAASARVRAGLTAAQQAAYPAFVVFPFAYLAIFSIFSDWQLWTWYFYCFHLALCVSGALLLAYEPANRILKLRPVSFGLAFIALCLTVTDHRRPIEGMLPIYRAATEIQAFSASHPGVYAMGDRAGIAGYLLPYPLVQTEGLVMDLEFLKAIKDQRSLPEVLARYKTDYYVFQAPLKP